MKKTFFFILKIFVLVPLLTGLFFMTFPLSYASDFSFSPNGDSAVNSRWADSVFRTMTEDERLGQLFMVEVSSKWTVNDKLFQDVEACVKNFHIGGVIFFYGGPCRQAALTNYLQNEAKIPLMIAQDGEWGLGMRLADSTLSFPRNLCLGAIENNEIIYELGREIGRQCNRLGVNIDFMPCIDIYDNPTNTAIANRSFGSDKLNVALKGSAMMSGMSDYHILTTAKHFPGHGNTAVDSHEALPVILDTKDYIDSVALYPYKYLINNGVGGVMVGHLFIPVYNNDGEKTPSSISKSVIDSLLIKTLKFNGLVFTDALKMKGVSSNYETGEVEVRAFEAGVDVFLMPSDCKKAFQAMVEARNSGRISQKEIDRRCKKILIAKKRMGLDKIQPIKIENLYADLNTDGGKMLQKRLYENAVTLIKNDSSLLPLRDFENQKIAVVSVSKDGVATSFENNLQRFAGINVFNISKTAEPLAFEQLINKLEDFDIIIAALHDAGSYPKNFGLSENTVKFIDNLALKNKKLIVDFFNSPLSINKFQNYKKITSIVISYEDTNFSHEVSSDMIFGVLPFLGKLPVDVNQDFKAGSRIKTDVFKL